MKTLRYRLDPTVLFFLLAVTLIAGTSFVYRFYTVPQCPDIDLAISEETIEAGKMIRFTNKSQGVSSIEWDFGDNSPVVNKVNATHSFAVPGEYVIRLTINNRCTDFRRIVVIPQKPIIDQSLIPKIKFPSSTEINKKVRFTCLTENAESYEWRFGESGKVDSRSRNPVYSFSTPGLKTVSLVINGNERYIAKEMVHVMSPPPPKIPKQPSARPREDPPEVPHVPDSPDDYASYDMMKAKIEVKKEKEKVRLSNEALGETIVNFAQGTARLTDFQSSFCGKSAKSLVEANGKLMKFPDFLESIKGKNVRIKELRTIRGEGGCIMQVILKYKK